MSGFLSKASMNFIKTLASTKSFLGFWLTMACILIIGYVAIMRDTSAVSYLPVVLGVYLGSKTLERGSAYWAASKDEACSTESVIEKITKE